MIPDSLKKLIDNLKSLPGVGEKSAERMAYSILDFDKDKILDFSSSIANISNCIRRCSICNCLSDTDICSVCSKDSRNKGRILVVERVKDVFLFEKYGFYDGVYHVLDGLISPLDGIGPDDITISLLKKRVLSVSDCELIFALKPGIESETTIQYINKVFNLENINVKISKLAIGVPLGAEMEYMDSMTLEFALEGRNFL